MKKIVVAIDGPAGAGKSTIAKLAAEKLGYAYIDTGAMYRSVAWKFLQTGKPFDEDFISGLSKTMLIDFKPEAKINRVFVDGTEVTDAIRTPEVTAIVSRVAAIGAVREAMVDQQRRMGEAGGVLMDGAETVEDAVARVAATRSPLKKPRPVVAAVDTVIRLKRQSRKAVVAAVVRDMAAEVMDTVITVTDTTVMVRALKNSFFTRSRRSFVAQPCSRQWILCR